MTALPQHAGIAARALAHAAEHDTGTCPTRDCEASGDKLRAFAQDRQAEQAARFEALDDDGRRVVSRAAAALVEARRHEEDGRTLLAAATVEYWAEELIDLFGLMT